MQAVFLDRDGVINENRRDHVKNWSEFDFLPGAPEAVARLSRAGVKVFVVTNQAIVNRGLVSRDVVDGINRRMMRELMRHGGRVEEVVYCPHRPEEQCLCRKPRPGLLLSLAERYQVDLADSFVIGDALSDVEAGLAVGSQTILVLTGRGKEQLLLATLTGKNGFAVVPDLPAAADLVLSRTAIPVQSTA